MAHVIATTLIHVPNQPPMRIDSTSTLHHQGVHQTLMMLGYTRIGRDEIWYAREHVTVVENGVPNRKIPQENRPLIGRSSSLYTGDITDV